MMRILWVLALGLAVGRDGPGVEGVVVDADGKRVAGAEVLLFRNFRTDGQELRRTSTGADGQFRFEDFSVDVRESRSWVAVAYKPGLALGAAHLGPAGDSFESKRIGRLSIRLRRPATRQVTVLDPDGQPLPQGRLGLDYFQVDDTYAAGEPVLAKLATFALDEHGRATVDVLGPDAAFAVLVYSEKFGTQRGGAGAKEESFTIRLQKVGRLAGTVVAEDPAAVRGLKVELSSRPAERRRPGGAAPRSGGTATMGFARVTTNDSGRFEVPALAEGTVNVQVEINEELPFRLTGPVQTTLQAGEIAELTIKLARAVRVFGTVIDDETSAPIPGATVTVLGKRVVSDEQGRYEALAAPGNMAVIFAEAPGLYLPAFPEYRNATVQAGATEHEVEPFRLKKGMALSGTVVDENGRLVAGARVLATWQKTDGQTFTIGSKGITSGDDGTFSLTPVPNDTELGLTALTDERATAQVKLLQPGNQEAVRLTVTSAAAAVFAGRVVDTDGRPVADAHVQFRKASRIPSGQIYGWGILTLAGQRELTTDAQGMFRTPVKLARNEQYSLAVEADGMLRYESKYLTPTAGDPVQLEQVVLQRVATVAGIVVDRAGAPVGGATVWSHGTSRGLQSVPVATETNEDGRYRLEGLHPEARLVFVEMDGYRLTGGVVPRADAELRLTLVRNDAPAEPLLSIQRSPDEQKRLLEALLLPILPALAESPSDYFRLEVLKRLMPYDRDFALEKLQDMRDNTSKAEILALAGEVDDALGFTELISDPYRKSFSYYKAMDAAADLGRKKEILATALVNARRIERPDYRTVILSGIAEWLYDLGEREAAAKVVEEGRAIAEQLAPAEFSGYARGNFAETLALFDSAAALELVKDLTDDGAHTRHVGNIAHELADINPAQAEQALKLIRDDRYVTPYAVRVCYRMAKVDLPRARRIADALVNDSSRGLANRPHAYGVMAMALADKDPKTARDLLHSAFEQLTSAPNNSYPRRDLYAVAVALVRYSETVDPEHTRDYFWKALSLHPGPGSEYSSPDNAWRYADENTAKLVLLLGMYGQCPELCKELMAPIFERWAGYTNRKEMDFYRQSAVFAAMALADPERTIAWHTAFNPKVSADDRRLIPQPWMTVADVFGNNGPALGKIITHEIFNLWVIDTEDL